MPVTDYPSKIVLAGYFIQEQEAGTVEHLELVATDDPLQHRQARRLPDGEDVERLRGRGPHRAEFSQEIFDRYNDHLIAACAAAQPPLPEPSAEARALMAIMAEHAKGGTPKRRAGDAVEAYLIHRGW